MQQPILFAVFLTIPCALFAQRHADCKSAMEICKKQTYTIERVGGEGADDQEADFVACFMNGDNFGQAEENSTWIKFEIKESGSLTFAITPLQKMDDIDFVVFKLPANGNCAEKQIVRCMAAGDSEDAVDSPCMGATGLREGETDSSEDAGCADPGDNTWLAPLQVKAKEKYVLLVSNVSTAGPGFTISFGGSAKLPCDEEPKKEQAAGAQRPPSSVNVNVLPPPVAAPATIGGRKVEVRESLKIKARTIKIRIWDSQVEDGDVVSVYLNEKKVVDRVALYSKPQEFTIQLPPGKEHYITVYADDFGKAEPNTAKVQIIDGDREQTIDLVAGRSKQESIKIIVD
jgi:hypothetical protein